MEEEQRIISRLQSRGQVTILETEEGTTVAIKKDDHVITLSNKDKTKLLIELEQITRSWDQGE